MDFREASDRLLSAGISLREIAEALGVSYAAVKQARLDRASEGLRSPPGNWRAPLARLAGERGAELSGLPDVILLLDEFGFEHEGRRFRCSPSGQSIASVRIGGLARPSNAKWDIEVDGTTIGTVPSEPDETEECIRALALELAEEMEGSRPGHG